MNTTFPDLFSNVHKGIRRALFEACMALGRARGDESCEREARATLGEALRFVAHHGENEDVLLLPLLRERAPDVFYAMTAEHHSLDAAREALASHRDVEVLYREACAFAARYVAHMDDEERRFEPRIRAALTAEEQADFGRRAIARTAPDDQTMMLRWMISAMPRAEANALSRLLPTDTP